MKNHLLIIGGASADILHTAGGNIPAPGGAGMYTAMAAHRCGTTVSLFAPKPAPMPDALVPVAERLAAWLGPVVAPEALAHFEIAYQGNQSTYLHFSVGAEAALSPNDLPADLSQYDCVHVIPLGIASRQLEFVRACRQRGARRISVGSYIEPIITTPDLVSEIFAAADVCFLNEEEAIHLFGSLAEAHTDPGKILFVTLGDKGCLVIQGEYATQLETQPTKALDPTGAGDTFCGAVLSGLLMGTHPILAARAAMPLASQMIAQIGPSALFLPGRPPEVPADSRVSVNQAQVAAVASMVSELPEVQAFNFVAPEFPPAGHSAALEFFFASTLQQFGFWSEREGRYFQPLIAPIFGDMQKGSSYLFLAYLRAMQNAPDFLSVVRQAALTEDEMRHLFRADDGTDPMPALTLHLAQARQYGQDMLALNLTPQEIIRQAQNSDAPLRTFLGLLDQIGGYKEDPLRKKSNLLALILNQRPEGFLQFGSGEHVAPVIDYHLMRSCLRVGLIDIHDPELREKVIGRQILSQADEWAVRWPAYQAVQQVVERSGKSMGAVDWFFFNARRRCPEMTEPVCGECPVDPICAHRKALFQPVIRTPFY